MPDGSSANFTIRGYRPEDKAACHKLYEEGLLGGRIAENDTGADIDDIDNAYMLHPGSYLWVAENAQGEVVGMIGLQTHEQGVGELRRLRVRQDHRRRGIGTALVEAALRYCQQNHYLKITLDTYMEREPAVRLFEKFHFRLDRTREVGGKPLLYFYLDLYGHEKRQGQ